jgi:monoamine oxidase
MAVRLGEDRVILGAPVAAVEHGGSGVRVISPAVSVRCRRAVITVPLPLTARLRYVPALPAARDHLTQRTPMGWIIKVHCIYARRFWLEEGLSGQVTVDEGVVTACADNSPSSGSPAILVGFIEGAAARRMAAVPPGERRAAVLADLGRYFGPAATRPSAYYEYLWGDGEFARGAEGGPGRWRAQFAQESGQPARSWRRSGCRSAGVSHVQPTVRSGSDGRRQIGATACERPIPPSPLPPNGRPACGHRLVINILPRISSRAPGRETIYPSIEARRRGGQCGAPCRRPETGGC